MTMVRVIDLGMFGTRAVRRDDPCLTPLGHRSAGAAPLQLPPDTSNNVHLNLGVTLPPLNHQLSMQKWELPSNKTLAPACRALRALLSRAAHYVVEPAVLHATLHTGLQHSQCTCPANPLWVCSHDLRPVILVVIETSQTAVDEERARERFGAGAKWVRRLGS